MAKNAAKDERMLDRTHHRTEGQTEKAAISVGFIINNSGGNPGRHGDDKQTPCGKAATAVEARPSTPKQLGIIRQPRS